MTKEIILNSKFIIKVLLLMMGVLLFFHSLVNVIYFVTGHGYLKGINPLFNFWDEHNFPSYFSSFNLLLSVLLIAIIFHFKNRNTDKFRRHWFFLMLIFLMLSVDEMLELHERFSKPVQETLNVLPGSLEYWAWVIPLSILVVFFALCYIPFFLNLPKRFKIYFFAAAAIYVFGAIGFEILEGIFLTKQVAQGFDLAQCRYLLPFVLMVTIEELMEMGGIVLFNYALLEYIKELPDDIVIKFK